MAKKHRQERLGEEIRKLISGMILRELKDPRFTGSMISITDVAVTADNSYATCYITVLPLGDSENREVAERAEEDALAGLASASPMIRRAIGSKMKLYRAPELIFKIDRSMEYGRHIDMILEGLSHDDEGKK